MADKSDNNFELNKNLKNKLDDKLEYVAPDMKFLDFLRQHPNYSKKFKDIYMNPKLVGKNSLLKFLEETSPESDNSTLKKIVFENSLYVNYFKDPELYKAHAILSLEADDKILALASITELSRTYKNSYELTGIVYYSMKEYPRASLFFSLVKNPAEENMTTLCRTISDFNTKYTHDNTFKLLNEHIPYYELIEYEKSLEKLLNNSPPANNFLGVVCYNSGEYERAQDYFIKEVVLSESSGKINEQARIKSLKALYAVDKLSALNNLEEFYSKTKSKISETDLIKSFETKKLAIPHVVISYHTLANVARKLLV